MFLREVDKQLKEHAARFDLENRAIKGCKQNLHNLLKEERDETLWYLRGYAIEDLIFQFVKHQFVFHGDRSWPHILSRVAFGWPNKIFWRNLEPLGYYDLETVEGGEISDDWFQWEQMRDEQGRLIEFSSVRD